MNLARDLAYNDNTTAQLRCLGDVLQKKATRLELTKTLLTASFEDREASGPTDVRPKMTVHLRQKDVDRKYTAPRKMETKKLVRTSRFPLPELAKDAYALGDEAWQAALTKPPLSTATIGPQGRDPGETVETPTRYQAPRRTLDTKTCRGSSTKESFDSHQV